MAVRTLAGFALVLVVSTAAQAMDMPFDSSSLHSAISDLTRTAADGEANRLALGRQLHQAAEASASGADILAGLSGLAGSSAASNAASNDGSSAAAAVSSAVQSLGAMFGQRVQTVQDVQTQLSTLLDQFCSSEKFTAPKVVPAQWVGGGASIVLQPHTCLIHPETHTMECSPAKLVLYRTQGQYNKQYTSRPEWKGMECKIQSQLGTGSSNTIGAAKYSVNFPQQVQFKSLWTPIFANQTGPATSNPATSAPTGGSAAAATVANNTPTRRPTRK